MQWPSWFQSAIQERLDDATARIQYDSRMSQHRAEEKKAFEALFSHKETTGCPEFAEWEDKHHYMRAWENERLYLQGMRDGANLIMALLSDCCAPVNEQGSAKTEKPEAEQRQHESSKSLD
ncbi:hypothetical protein [Cohnella boryungensis]|uniref:Uncharacterized protein n=1 Tax=Cohnella boryungensis TaxID=768479 RepID=A0ABV8SDC2_9BACL